MPVENTTESLSQLLRRGTRSVKLQKPNQLCKQTQTTLAFVHMYNANVWHMHQPMIRP
jgi:hypothetical protein